MCTIIIQSKKRAVAETILKSFIDEDILEKAQYVHKYTLKEMTKNGKTIYVYAQPRNVERIKGKKKMLDNGKEITLKSKTLMPYTYEMKEELGREILSLDRVSALQWSKSKSTESNYLKFKKGNVKFKVRISSHTKYSFRNEVLFPMSYDYWNELWVIDTNLGRYTTLDVKQIVENTCGNLSQYDNDETKKRIRKLALNDNFEPEDEEDVFNLSFDFAEKYINEKKLKDDKYGSVYSVKVCECYGYGVK